MFKDTAPVRAGEEIEIAGLSRYLGQPVEVEQFPGGHSNLTYLVRTPQREYVLRRAPLGPVAPKAHDMAREFAVLSAVAPVFRPAPRVYRLCQDASVIGSTFFLMERRHGIILRTSAPPEITAIPGYQAKVSQAFLDCLVSLHSIDVSRQPLASLGKPEGFVERQVRGWAERWARAKTEELPEMDGVIKWLSARLPQPGVPSLVHNDYKLDNLMLRADDPGEVEALLDWEMTTLGDPLADFGLALTYWVHADVPGMERITTQPGWATRDALVQEYALRTGRDMSALPYHEVLGVFKLAVILQQIYFRYFNGQTRDGRFQHFDQAVARLARTAARLVEEAG